MERYNSLRQEKTQLQEYEFFLFDLFPKVFTCFRYPFSLDQKRRTEFYDLSDFILFIKLLV
jgi:hypothetical protein